MTNQSVNTATSTQMKRAKLSNWTLFFYALVQFIYSETQSFNHVAIRYYYFNYLNMSLLHINIMICSAGMISLFGLSLLAYACDRIINRPADPRAKQSGGTSGFLARNRDFFNGRTNLMLIIGLIYTLSNVFLFETFSLESSERIIFITIFYCVNQLSSAMFALNWTTYGMHLTDDYHERNNVFLASAGASALASVTANLFFAYFDEKSFSMVNIVTSVLLLTSLVMALLVIYIRSIIFVRPDGSILLQNDDDAVEVLLQYKQMVQQLTTSDDTSQTSNVPPEPIQMSVPQDSDVLALHIHQAIMRSKYYNAGIKRIKRVTQDYMLTPVKDLANLLMWSDTSFIPIVMRFFRSKPFVLFALHYIFVYAYIILPRDSLMMQLCYNVAKENIGQINAVVRFTGAISTVVCMYIASKYRIEKKKMYCFLLYLWAVCVGIGVAFINVSSQPYYNQSAFWLTMISDGIFATPQLAYIYSMLADLIDYDQMCWGGYPKRNVMSVIISMLGFVGYVASSLQFIILESIGLHDLDKWNDNPQLKDSVQKALRVMCSMSCLINLIGLWFISRYTITKQKHDHIMELINKPPNTEFFKDPVTGEQRQRKTIIDRTELQEINHERASDIIDHFSDNELAIDSFSEDEHKRVEKRSVNSCGFNYLTLSIGARIIVSLALLTGCIVLLAIFGIRLSGAGFFLYLIGILAFYALVQCLRFKRINTLERALKINKDVMVPVQNATAPSDASTSTPQEIVYDSTWKGFFLNGFYALDVTKKRNMLAYTMAPIVMAIFICTMGLIV